MRRTVLAFVTFFLALTLVPVAGAGQSLLIRGARVVDGTGAPGRTAAVRVEGDRVVAVGALALRAGEEVVEADGLVLAPGFIDTHSHHDRGLLAEPGALGAVSQGITTVVVGQDGSSRIPLAGFFQAVADTGVAPNVASYVGHGALRWRVMGEDHRRPATPGEVAEMTELLRAEMDAGALGLSTGLEYGIANLAGTEEVLALAREAGRAGGRYITHMRSEDRALWEAVEEAIRIGREAGVPVQISHMKLAMKGLWGDAERLLDRLDRARRDGVEITADVYPYTFWQSTMTVLIPERDFEDRSAFEFALRELAPPEGILLARYEPEPAYEGRTLAEVASERGEDPVDTYMALTQEAVGQDAEESIIATSMAEEDVVRLLRWPYANVASDGALRGGHPRGFGSFTRVVGPWVREGRLTLEEAVHKSTALAAAHVGLPERGVIRPGAPADLVLFDPATVGDRATPDDPWAVSTGIHRVWVGGEVVYTAEDGATGARPGRVLRRTGAAPSFSAPAPRRLPRGSVSDSVAAGIDAVFADIDDTRTPGCAVGVLRDGALVFARGYGMADLEHGVPLSPTSVFRIGSVSKQVTAGVVALLDLEGVLDLDDPVRRWIPELPDYGPEFTLRSLLHHTSGARDYLTLATLAGLEDQDWYSDQDLLELVTAQRETNFPPGSEHLYSNSGYWLLSQVVLRATGRTLAQVAEERLFRPLGMDATHYHDDPGRIVPDRAVGYAPLEEGGWRISTTTLPMIGDGGVFTSVEELALWARNLVEPEVGGPAWREAMLRRGVLTTGDTLTYALGLEHRTHRGRRTVGHGGSFVGYRADLTRFPDDDLTVLTLCNRADANPSRRARRVAEVFLEPIMDPVAEEGGGGSDPDGTAPAAVALEAGERAAWAGRYRSDELDAVYRVVEENGGLRLEVGNFLDGPLEARDRDTLARYGVTLTVVERAGGRVQAFRVAAGRVTDLHFRRVP